MSNHHDTTQSFVKRISSHHGGFETNHTMIKLTNFQSFLDKFCDGKDQLIGATVKEISERYFQTNLTEQKIALIRSHSHSASSTTINSNIITVYVVPNPENLLFEEIQALLDYYQGSQKPVYLIYPLFTAYEIALKEEEFQAFTTRVSVSVAVDERVVIVPSLEQPFERTRRKSLLSILTEIHQFQVHQKSFQMITNQKERKRIASQIFLAGSTIPLQSSLQQSLSLQFEEFFPVHAEDSSEILTEQEKILVSQQDQLREQLLTTIIEFIHRTGIIEEKCYARVGLMGNPSDGFKGCTLSFLIKNFAATVILIGNNEEENKTIELKESNQYQNIDHYLHQAAVVGYNSAGLRLLQATLKVFFKCCEKVGIDLSNHRGFSLTFSTTIPRMVGLSGSSAIIVAAFRALLKYYQLTVDDLHISKTEFPEEILNIEKEELGISAGLQDRVIQTYGGLVHMDFTRSETKSQNKYTELDPSLLPPLYLIYNTIDGGDSGQVHSTVKERWAAKDPSLLQGMQTLGSYANEAVVCLQKKDYQRLGQLMEMNFQTRRNLYSDAVVGEKNVQIAGLAKVLGLSVKFTGSGGAFVAVRRDGLGWFDVQEEIQIRQRFREHNFECVRIEIP